MSFDPSFQYTQGIGAGVPDSTDITGTPAGVDPSEDPTKNEYYTQRLLTPPWIQAGFPDYQSYAANLRLKEEQARALSQKQIDASAGASGASVTAARISTQGANDRAAVQAQIDQAKNAADAAHQQAIDALSQGNAAEAKRQFDISSAELQRYHSLDIADRQQQQSLASAKFGNDVYTQLANLASNPRNFMEQFFRNRGQTPPPNVGQYGNTSVTGPGLMSAQQFIPSFLGSLGLGGTSTSSPGAGAAYSPAASAPPPNSFQGQAFGTGQGSAYSGLNHFNQGGPITLAQNDPDAAGLMAKHPGMYQMGPDYGLPTASHAPLPSYGGPSAGTSALSVEGQQQAASVPNPSDWLKAQMPKMMAQGGEVTMTAPHALINLLTGKVAAIAGEAGKEHAKFDGAAIIDPLKNQTSTDPLPPDGTQGYQYSGGSAPIGPSAPASSGYDTTDTTDILNAPPPTTSFPGDPSLRSTYTTPQGSPTPPPPTASSGLTPALIAQAQAAAAAANSALPPGAVGSVAAPQTPTTTPPPTPFFPGGTPEMPTPNTTFTPPTNPVNSWGGPLITPLPGEGFGGARGPGSDSTIIPPMPGEGFGGPRSPTFDEGFGGPRGPAFAPSNPLAQTPSGIGQNPTFLPEDAAAKDPILAAMLASGSFPPFLQRLYAQAKGLPGLGTNTLQPTDLPPGLPLISKLAFNQMSPSELAAFESYVSAHGVDWTDYVSMVQNASPQGGVSNTTAVPKFLSQ